MRMTIIAGDNVVGVDRVFRTVDLSALDVNISAVQWDGAKGHIEFMDRRPEEKFTSIDAFQSFIDGWVAAAPLPPTLAQLKAAKGAKFIVAGVARVALQVPDWDTLDTIKTVAGLWVSHLATNATPAQLVAKNIYLYVRDTVPAKLAVVADQAALDAIDPSTADPFGDGTPWPT